MGRKQEILNKTMLYILNKYDVSSYTTEIQFISGVNIEQKVTGSHTPTQARVKYEMYVYPYITYHPVCSTVKITWRITRTLIRYKGVVLPV